MVITNTRINEKGEKEIVISDFSSFKELVDEIHKIRIKEINYNERPKKIIVKKDVRENLKIITYPINFSNVVFEKDVSIINVLFIKSVIFINTIFKKNANFNKSSFLGKETNFTMAEFNTKQVEDFETHKYSTKFDEVTFSNKVYFAKTKFKSIAHFFHAKFINIQLLSFNATFEKITRFNEATFIGENIKFNGAKFNDKVTFHHCIFNNNISFENTEFHKLADFYDATFKEPQQFHLTDFLDRVIFSDATFKQEVQFLHCKVNSSSIINFHSTKFEKGLDISRSNFNICKMSFWDIKVDDDGLLGDTLSSEYYKNNFGDNEYPPSVPKKLRESMRFIKNSFYSEGNRIEGSNFEKKELEVYREELYTKMRGTGTEKKKSTLILSKEEVASIFGMYIPLIIYLNNNENKNLYWMFIVLSIFFLLFLIITKSTIGFKEGIKNIKEIIKSNLIVYSVSIFVFISTLFFYLYGLYLYPQNNNPIIWYILNFAFLSPIFIFFNLTKDYIILLFNKYSNDFGTNWVNGVVFTLLISMITFVFMATFSDLTFAWHERGVNNVLEGILEIINLFPFKETNEDSLFYNMNTGTKIVLFIGRIFIGYGVYQTIQAFRKYGKS